MKILEKMKSSFNNLVEEALAEEAKAISDKKENVINLKSAGVEPSVYGNFSTVEEVKPIREDKKEKKKVVGFSLGKSKADDSKKVEQMPCSDCSICKVCSKAYSISVPSVDDNMFKVNVVCNMQITKCSEDEDTIYLKQEKKNIVACDTPCAKCGISDICSKNGTLKVPKYDTDIFGINIRCTRFVKSEEDKEIETLVLGDV